jgi:hypothetical protein
MFLHAASRPKFEAILGSDMRPLFAILGPLLCLIATRADELPVTRKALQDLLDELEASRASRKRT